MGAEPGFQVGADAPRRYEEHVAAIMAPFVAAAVEAAGLARGSAVLDLACGTGFVARAAAAAVGPDGHVAGVDVNPGMLAVAAGFAGAGPDAAEVRWQQAAAEKLPYEDDEFDAVVAQQGAQFFADLEAALGEVKRVLRPGGRVVLTVWATLDRSPFFLAQRLAIEAVAGSVVAESFDAAFACSARQLTAALRSAGFAGVSSREVSAEVALPPLAAFAPGQLAALPWGPAVAGKGPDAVAAYTETLTDLLCMHVSPDGRTVLPFTSILVAATA
ncbi:class I SAM-dependent methyltransferase [Yinghuangia soli]|uniref:Methyltransferase domain-containing protein n=1 Tax=Yinghuangia soli TaxID=2908204 RepID=A0AA41Q4E4_9ACTN|nr:methyltransferase domain-containing protein [Yinghuangia soli]MCF2530496.1 methyltransferase domain-containing protein [Yinghuangia soli]